MKTIQVIYRLIILLLFIAFYSCATVNKFKNNNVNNSLSNSNLLELNEIESIVNASNVLTDSNLNENNGLVFGRILPKQVNVKDSIAKLFDPDFQPCPLPDKVLKQLRKLKSNKQMWVPNDLAKHLVKYPDKALYFSNENVPVLLHTITIKRVNGKLDTLRVLGASTIQNGNISEFVASNLATSFGFTLDCSGLFSAVLDGVVKAPGSDFASKASLAYKETNSMFIGGGVVVSPLFAAYRGKSSAVELAVPLRIEILESLLDAVQGADKDSVKFVTSYEVIWVSNHGGERFNGDSNLSVGGSYGIGFAQASAKGDAGGSVSRTTKFSSFDTYLTNINVLNPAEVFTVSEIKKQVTELKKIK